jgi:hypothetical protein
MKTYAVPLIFTMTNSETTREIVQALKLNEAVDKTPLPIPVIEVNPKLTKRALCANIIATNSTGATLVNTGTQDVYIDSAQLAVIKDITSTSLRSELTFVQNGTTQRLLCISSISLTPQSETISCSFPHAIKCDRGTNISIVNTTGTANITTFGSVTYHVDEASNG